MRNFILASLPRELSSVASDAVARPPPRLTPLAWTRVSPGPLIFPEHESEETMAREQKMTAASGSRGRYSLAAHIAFLAVSRCPGRRSI